MSTPTSNRPIAQFRERSRFSVSTDHRQQMSGKYCGQSLIGDEHRNEYVTDWSGKPITFAMPYDAERWLERQWMKAVGIQA